MPEETKHDKLIYKIAKSNGCKPFWYDGIIEGWHCGCPNERHWYDEECSAITIKSANRK
jgi:hypothetical protein